MSRFQEVIEKFDSVLEIKLATEKKVVKDQNKPSGNDPSCMWSKPHVGRQKVVTRIIPDAQTNLNLDRLN